MQIKLSVGETYVESWKMGVNTHLVTLQARRSWHSWKSSASLKYEISFSALVQAESQLECS